ncbi:MAG: DegQ family serine endoprotease [Alphaproteobacteria bacterium]|nr:DegQ family serine endoprotease [Alphaproteobacteria bacterium]
MTSTLIEMKAGRTRWRFAGTVVAVLVLTPTLSRGQSPGEPSGTVPSDLTRQTQSEINIQLPTLAPLVERVMPAVVNISVQLKEQAATQSEGDASNESGSPLEPGSTPFDQFLKRFFGQPFQFRNPAEKVIALGSGFIIGPAGEVVTNNHVVANADKVTVILQDNSRHTARVAGRDEKTDIALLKIDSRQNLPYVTLGNSDDARVGDWVVAVGNPFGLGGSVTAGIISALGRDINEGPYDDFLQIDAPINRGNSGGPTFNLHGQVIGINTAIYSPSGGSVGIGFAVPSNIAERVVRQLKEHGHVTWGWLGVAVQSITPAIARSLGLDPDQATGALVASVSPDSPAAKAGIRQGDVISTAAGHEVKTVHDLPRLVAATPVGGKLQLTIIRERRQQTVEATIGQMPQQISSAQSKAASPAGGSAAAALGMELLPLDAQLRKELNVAKDVNGVVVGRVEANSAASELGIESGDVIESVDQKPVAPPDEAATRLKDASDRGNVLLLLNRRGANRFVALPLNKNGTAGSSR